MKKNLFEMLINLYLVSPVVAGIVVPFVVGPILFHDKTSLLTYFLGLTMGSIFILSVTSFVRFILLFKDKLKESI